MAGDLNNVGLGVSIGASVGIFFLLVVISTVFSYFSFRGMLTWGIAADTFFPYLGKTILNSMTGGLLGIGLYLFSDNNQYRDAALRVKAARRGVHPLHNH